jgi:hypothetical protein
MHVAAVAAGQRLRQRFHFYSGVKIFNWYYLSSPSQIPRAPGPVLKTGTENRYIRTDTFLCWGMTVAHCVQNTISDIAA